MTVRRLCSPCMAELTETDLHVGHCTQCEAPVVDIEVEILENKLAALTVEALRKGGASSLDILAIVSANSTPKAEAQFVREVFESHRLRIRPSAVRAEMRRLVTH